MKNRIWDFLKAFGAFAGILLFIIILVMTVVAELFPAVIPDWMYTVFGIIGVPFVIIFFVVIFKEWHKQRKAKKEEQKKK